MPKRQHQVREILWGRIASGLHRGELRPGQRLPSTRQLGTELGAAPRTIMAAYADLAQHGLVELRRRSGIYVAPGATGLVEEPAVPAWPADLLLEGWRHGVLPQEMPGRLAQLLDPAGQRALCVAGNLDQADHMCREVQGDYGLAAVPLLADQLSVSGTGPGELEGASVLVTTALVATIAQDAGRRLGLPVVVVRLREDIVQRMIAELREGPVYFLGTDPRFSEALRLIFEPTGWAHRVRPVILGRDDPDGVPVDRPIYVLERAWERLGQHPITSLTRPLPRVFSVATARQLLTAILRFNLNRTAARAAARPAAVLPAPGQLVPKAPPLAG